MAWILSDFLKVLRFALNGIKYTSREKNIRIWTKQEMMKNVITPK